MSVYKRGGVYWFNFTFNGKPIQRSTKQGNRRAAVEIMAAFRTSLAKGEVGIAPKKNVRRSVGQLLDELKANYEASGKLSPQNRSLIKRAKEDFESKLATELTAEDVVKYVERRKKQGAKNASINRVSEILRRAYNLAGIASPKIQKLSEKDNVRKGFFNEAELDSTISYLPVDLQDFVRFAGATGMRKGEASKLTWKMVQDGELRIPREICKNREDRVLPLEGEIKDIIERRRQEMLHDEGDTARVCLHIFHRNGDPVAELCKSWQTAAIAAGLGIMVCKKCAGDGPEKSCRKCKTPRKYRGKLFHDLRRSAVRNMVKAGANTQIAKAWSGHKTDSMFYRYCIVTTDDMREVLKKTEAYRKEQREKVVAIAGK